MLLEELRLPVLLISSTYNAASFCFHFRELVDKQPSSQTCQLLGEAYMSIQEVVSCLILLYFS